MLEDETLFNLLIPKSFYLSVLIIFFDYFYQQFFISYPFYKKVISNKSKLQENDTKKSTKIIDPNIKHKAYIIKLTKALTILLLSRALIVTLSNSENVSLVDTFTNVSSIVSTTFILFKCLPREKLKTIMLCSITQKDRLKIVIQSDILLSFNSAILFYIKTLFTTHFENFQVISILVFVNFYIVSIRFIQCIRERNWLNVLKYGLNYPVLYCMYHDVNNNTLYYFKIAQTFYGALWDLLMDWKLHVSISSRVLNKSTIISLAITALLLKFSFLYAHVFNGITFILLTLEIVRRLIWVLLRLDYEYYAL
ncbi:uncharacterized protein HGUI_00891 [Hanseniaspora guilliermondii]|uniref:EXS domain-containing protein n=1 Tax=Hanseniaspora guilliermondii TaxID=56406 RepID=A0A1L0B144_9ASCO|nr:uncharacterized protein HGUI_00891 [Hanseniaspora guilliermondii]